jgi:FkbM family methyltransferase
VDKEWFMRNVRDGVEHGCSIPDMLNVLRWRYSSRCPRIGWGARPRLLRLQYPPPVGRICAAVRCNRGSDSFIFGEVFHHRYYSLPLVCPPRTILDLGANAGFTALFFSRTYPAAEIACVEPIPANIECLKLNLELNGIAARVFQAAIAPHDGMVSMALAKKDYGHHVWQEADRENESSILRVPAISIPTCLEMLKWERINLLKIDIEGYESVLLVGQCEWLRVVDTICIECHADYGLEDLSILAERWGFLQPERLSGIWLLTRYASTQAKGRLTGIRDLVHG